MLSAKHGRSWEPDEQILQQDLWREQLFVCRPVTVVEDRPDLLALYTHPNAPYRSRSVFRGSRYAQPLEDRVSAMMGDFASWEVRMSGNYHVLTLTPPVSWHSVWLFWTADWRFQNWYVNFQAPLQRTLRGILVRDYALDIIVRPDMSWSWKDEDEFTQLHRRGFFTDEQVVSVRAEAERMTRIIDGNVSPFCDGWEHWRPDPQWPVPEIPDDWHVLDERAANTSRY